MRHMGLVDMVEWKEWEGETARIERYFSAVLLVMVLAFFGLSPLIYVAWPAFYSGSVWLLYKAMTRSGAFRRPVVWTATAVLVVAAGSLVSLIGGSPIGLEGPPGTGLDAFLPSVFAEIGMVLARLAMFAPPAMITVFLWHRWSDRFRRVAATGTGVYGLGYVLMFTVLRFFDTTPGTFFGEARTFVELGIYAGMGMLCVAHLALWFGRSRLELDETPIEIVEGHA